METSARASDCWAFCVAWAPSRNHQGNRCAGWPDLYVTSVGANALYRNDGSGHFVDMTAIAGVGTELCSAGRAFGGIDNDTGLDLAVANGDVIDNIDIVYPSRTYEQRNLLLANDVAGRFTDVGPLSGQEFALEKVGHELAVGDLDNRIAVIVEGEGIARTAPFNRGPWRPW